VCVNVCDECTKFLKKKIKKRDIGTWLPEGDWTCNPAILRKTIDLMYLYIKY